MGIEEQRHSKMEYVLDLRKTRYVFIKVDSIVTDFVQPQNLFSTLGISFTHLSKHIHAVIIDQDACSKIPKQLVH